MAATTERKPPVKIAKVAQQVIDGLAEAPPTDAELDRARRMIRASVLDSLEQNRSRARQLAWCQVTFGTPDCLAAEWARYGIRANAIAPGPFESEGSAGNLWPNDEARAHVEAGIPLKRFGTADEVAAQCLHMLSPACDWMTGECVVLDGGSSLARPFWEPGQRFRRKREAE